MSGIHPKAFIHPKAIVEEGATIGEGTRVWAFAHILAGAVVGNPARIVGYVDTPLRVPIEIAAPSTKLSSSVAGVSLREIRHVDDLRGDLCAAEWETDIPFSPKRVFYVYNVPSVRVRGEHAHKNLHQFIIALSGAFDVLIDDGINRKIVHLDRPYVGLHIISGIWKELLNFSSGSVSIVLASELYDEQDYIRDYETFKEYKKRNS